MSEQYALDALQSWEDAMDLGREIGECGICGKSLNEVDLDHGLCHSCQCEFAELFEGQSFTELVWES